MSPGPLRGGGRRWAPARIAPSLAAALLVAGACSGEGASGGDAGRADPGVGRAAGSGTAAAVPYGPADGADLPGEALDRVAVGDIAPDFTLASFRGAPVTLSEYRGSRPVLLVFYRGHW